MPGEMGVVYQARVRVRVRVIVRARIRVVHYTFHLLTELGLGLVLELACLLRLIRLLTLRLGLILIRNL